ncbi:MAG TPA: cobalt-precorrin-6A reductase [Actinomycetales bacterium]|jgi:precorrin-6A/cobalt-precorrin-6A reductase
MTVPTLLLLGGTAEGRELAGRLVEVPGLRVVTSLAGRLTGTPQLAGEVRTGGFGGVDGLAEWLRDNAPALIVDATHPFAAQISGHVAEAAQRIGTPALRLQRPGWTQQDGDRWLRVPDLPSAARALPLLGRRPLVTTGRQGLGELVDDPSCRGLALVVRCAEAPTEPVPAHVTLLVDRGPFDLSAELSLLRGHGIDVLVTKDSGGDDTRAKLDAARRLGLPVVVVDRPPAQGPPVGTVDDVAAAERWVRGVVGPGDADR